MRDRTQLQRAAMLVGIVFLLVGILGFIPGITQNYEDMKFAGHSSDAELLGVFQVSVLHNVVHLLLGIAGIVLSRTWDGARMFLIGGGALYLVIWLYGYVTEQRSGANFVPMNVEDDYLHFILGAGMIALGVVLSRRPHRGRRP